MPNQKFQVILDNFMGGLAPSPETGALNQFVNSSGADFFSEPGVIKILPGVSTALTLPANTDTLLRDFTKIMATDSATRYYAIGSDSSLLNARILSSSDMATWSLATASSLAWGSTSSLSASRLVEFGAASAYNLFFIWGNQATLGRWTNFPTTPATFSDRNVSGAIFTDLLNHLGYLFYAYCLPTANNTLNYIGRFDGTNFNDTQVQLDNDFIPWSMAQWNDFVVIGASNTRYRPGGNQVPADVGPSRLYVWDGVSNTFDKKVTIPELGLRSVKNVNGTIHAVCVDGDNNIKVYLWNGGDGVILGQRFITGASSSSRIVLMNNNVAVDGEFVHILPQTTGTGATLNGILSYGRYSSDQNRFPWMRRDFGATTVNGFALNVIDGTMLATYNDGSANAVKSVPGGTGSAIIRTTIIKPDIAGQSIIDKIKVRHTDLAATDTLTIAYNKNQQSNTRTFTGTNIINKTGTASLPGPGPLVNEVRSYSYTEAGQGVPKFPILDEFQLYIYQTGSFKIILPIVIDGEIVSTP